MPESRSQLRLVYLVQRIYDYEGFEVMGAYSTEAKAQTIADAVEWKADGVEVVRIVVDQSPDDGTFQKGGWPDVTA